MTTQLIEKIAADFNAVPKKPSAAETLKTNWRKLVAPYQHAELDRSIFMLADSLLPFIGLWALMIFTIQYSYGLTLALIIPTAAFQARLFIIFHDCGHGSYFKSHKANSLIGFFMGVLLMTPSEDWWHQHALHHATAGNLDKRGFGDVSTWTVEEYLQSTPFKRLVYGFFRHPLIMFTFGPIYSFVLMNRFNHPGSGKKERRSVALTNLSLVVLFSALYLGIGWQHFLMIQVPLVWLAGAIGIWLFYIQHQYENVYWVREADWDFTNAALEGASYYKLPRLLQWFTGNIGFHHIHHLSPRIPNYLLEKCYQENPPLQEAETITLRSSLKSISLRLWDEKAQKLVSFRDIKAN